jgi:putative ABC transport system permease protein
MFSELWSDIRYRLRALFRRAGVERDLDDEVRFHVDRDDARGIGFAERVMHDVRYAVRGFRARPVFAAVVIITLALGVGVNAAMFGVLDRLLFRTPAYLHDPASVNRVYVAWTTDRGRGWLREGDYAEGADFGRWSRSISQLATFTYYASLAVGSGDDVRESTVGIVSATMFDFFDARPVIGRFFTAEEDRPPAGEPVVVLGYDYWHTHYAGRRDILGSRLAIGRATYTVVGVAPKGFEGISDQRPPVAFIPVNAYASGIDARFDNTQRARITQDMRTFPKYGSEWLEMLVRRRPGVSAAEASADLTNAFRLSYAEQVTVEASLPPLSYAKPAAMAAPLQLARGPLAGPESRVAMWISGVAFIVLLIACANVANLLLARALRRRREIAVRQALGGTRARLIQQLLTETLILALFGGAIGLVVAQLGAAIIGRLLLGADGAFGVLTDWRTLVFSLTLTLVVAIFAGIVPALHQGTDHLADSLKAGVREGTYRQSRTRTALLVVQAALSVLLLVGAGLFTRSLHQVRSVHLGYDVDPLIYVKSNMRGLNLPNSERALLDERFLAEARAIPGVVNATRIVSIPFGTGESRRLSIPGIDSVRRAGRITLQAGSPDFFATLGTRIVRGRAFTAADRAGSAPVMIVSAAMAKQFWGSQDAIGKCVHVGGDTMPCRGIVGIAEDIRSHDLSGPTELQYYLPAEQRAAMYGAESPALMIRVAGRADDYAERVRAKLQPLMPGASYVSAIPMHEKVDPRMQTWEAGATLFLAFGALALTLAAVGLYAVIAFSVAQRAHELGVRIALGAQAEDILKLVVGEGIAFTGAGIVMGGGIALAAGHWMQPLLFDVSASDPLTYALVAVVLLTVGVLASAFPAARAARVDPTVALRTD